VADNKGLIILAGIMITVAAILLWPKKPTPPDGDGDTYPNPLLPPGKQPGQAGGPVVVVYATPSGSTIHQGGIPAVTMAWRNDYNVAYAPKLRLDIKTGGVWDTWLEGNQVQAPTVQPGQERTITLQGIPVPANWGAGRTIHLKIVCTFKGMYPTGIFDATIWSANDVYTIV